jgi:hypothetical protein
VRPPDTVDPSTIEIGYTEKRLQSVIWQMARAHGWTRSYHTYNARRSSPGFPDLVMVRDGAPGRLIFAELKGNRSGSRRIRPVPTAAQIEWLDSLASTRAEVYFWRPEDLDEIDAILESPAQWAGTWTTRWTVGRVS